MNGNSSNKEIRWPRHVVRRSIDRPVVAIHFYLTCILAVAILTSTIAILGSDDRPNHLTFRESAEVRALCYAWASLAVIVTSWVLRLGWVIPITLFGMLAIPPFLPHP